LTAVAGAQTWKPPVGIPAPAFGITQTAPPSPSPWVVQTSGFYYVDATAPASTDTSNSNGTPAKPRKTIPTRLPAGSVVEVRGVYSFTHTSPRGILSSGTAAKPVFIRGAGATRPRVTGCWEVSGSYYVIENLEFSTCGSLIFLARTNYAALRHSEVRGTLSGGGVGVESWSGETVSQVVIWNNKIHDNGDVHASYDQDIHGIVVGARVNYLWVLDNELYRNSGDGIQINAGTAGLQSTTHHIFVGRNVSHDNKQTGFWSKQAVDVIFSSNRAYGHRPGNSSLGACMGSQYATERLWFINNVMWDCDYGIQIASDAGEGTGTLQFVIGNIITRVHDTDGNFQPGSAWQNCAISLPGGTNLYVMQNSIYDVDSGICVPNVHASLYVYDNLVQRIRSNGHHLMFDSPVMSNRMVAHSNLFAPVFRLGVGGSEWYETRAESAVKGGNNLVGDVGWVDAPGGDFRLLATSPARDLGSIAGTNIWDYFRGRYGVPLNVDIFGTARGTSPDIGAAER
jgi:hypothetical protein